MKKVGLYPDFFKDDLLGGGEINDNNNLINHLESSCEVNRFHSRTVKIEDLNELDSIIVANFTMLNPQVMNYLISDKEYIIYEHDHKYVDTNPSKFKGFQIRNLELLTRLSMRTQFVLLY